VTQPIEVSVPPPLLKRILELADNGMILVGGQALAFWTAYYNSPAPLIAITKDVDFLGTKADVERMARGLDALGGVSSRGRYQPAGRASSKGPARWQLHQH